ncbi:hypothetical protein CYMTET_45893, partial [Cymbomonas tetramitiformis]
DAKQRARAFLGCGIAYTKQGKASEAADVLNDAVQLRPADHGLRIVLASALKSAGQPETALEHLRVAAQKDPKVTEAYITPLLKELEKK